MWRTCEVRILDEASKLGPAGGHGDRLRTGSEAGRGRRNSSISGVASLLICPLRKTRHLISPKRRFVNIVVDVPDERRSGDPERSDAMALGHSLLKVQITLLDHPQAASAVLISNKLLRLLGCRR